MTKTFHSMKPYYDSVLEGNLEFLLERHSAFPEIVLRCAIDDYNYSVVDKLLKAGYKPKFGLDFKSVFQADERKKFGFKTVSIEPEADVIRKFEMIQFLVDRKALSDDVEAVPHFLKERFEAWQKEKNGESCCKKIDVWRICNFIPYTSVIILLLILILM